MNKAKKKKKILSKIKTYSHALRVTGHNSSRKVILFYQNELENLH